MIIGLVNCSLNEKSEKCKQWFSKSIPNSGTEEKKSRPKKPAISIPNELESPSKEKGGFFRGNGCLVGLVLLGMYVRFLAKEKGTPVSQKK